MYYILNLLRDNTTPQDPNPTPVVLIDNPLRRCPQDVLEIIYSYLDGKSLLTFRLVQKMLPEQQRRYSQYLNQYFQLNLLKPEPEPYPSPFQILAYASKLVYSMLGYEMYYFPLATSPIFDAFDTIHLPKQLQTLQNLNRAAQLFKEQKRPFKGLNLEAEHLNSLINDLLSPEADHPMAKALPGIEHLYLRTDKQIEKLPALLKKIKSLKTLVLNSYLFTQYLIDKMTDKQLGKRFHALESLGLPNTNIAGQALARLLKSIDAPLKLLDLSECETIYWLPQHLNNEEIYRIFGPIEDLKLENIRISPKILASILKGCRSLRRLSLANCSHITGLFNELSKDNKLEQLVRIAHGPFEKRYTFEESETALDNLLLFQKEHQARLHAIFKNIRDLNLRVTALNSDDLKGILSLCSSVIHLNLIGCLGISNAIDSQSGDKFILAIRKIETLNLAISEISMTALDTIFRECHSLRRLGLSHCTNLTAVVSRFVMHDPQWVFGRFTDLDLSYTGIETLQLEFLLTGSRSLVTLDLSKCRNISELVLKNTPAALENLFGHISTLNLGKTKIEAEALVALLPACRSLKKLSLNFCESISEAFSVMTPEALTHIFASIQSVDFRYSKLTHKAAKKLRAAAPHLEKDIEKSLK